MASRPKLFKQIEEMTTEDIMVHRMATRMLAAALKGELTDSEGKQVKMRPRDINQTVKALNASLTTLPAILREIRRHKEAGRNAPLALDLEDIDEFADRGN